MKRFFKWLLWIVGVIVVLLLIIIAAVIIFIDPIVSKGTGYAGTKALGVQVALPEVDISIFKGNVNLGGLTVANPPDYKRENAFSMDKFILDVDMATVTSDKIVINEVTIDGVTVDIEMYLTSGKSNLLDIKHNLDQFLAQYMGDEAVKEEPAPATAEPAPATDESAPAKPAKQMVIRKLNFTNAKVAFSALDLGVNFTVPLPDMHMTDIGEGKSMAETINDLWMQLIGAISDAVASAGGVINMENFNKAMGAVTDGLGALGGNAGELLNSTGQALNDAGKGLSEGLKSGADSAGELLDSTGKGLNEAGKNLNEAGKGISDGIKSGVDSVRGIFK